MVINLPILCKARQKPVQRGQEGSGRRGLEQLLQKCGWPSENEGHWELGPSSGYQHRFWDHETDKNNVYETLAIFTMHHFWAHQSDREVRRGLWFHLHRIKNIGCPPTINKVSPFLSDPGPIIVYPWQSLTHWLTHWLTTLLKIEWIDLNMHTMQTMQTM